MTKFSDLGLNPLLMKAIAEEGYETPTPIQAQAIPLLLEDKDLLGIAQTGTGKTAAFALPTLDFMLEFPQKRRARSARVLVLAPTRELAGQIADSFRTYSRHMDCNVQTVFGGVNINAQRRALQGGADVLVATPGRLLDLVGQKAVSLQEVEVLILDEADQMLDMGFIPAIRQIMAKVNTERQTMLFSATMPKEIRRLADDFMNDPLEVSVSPVSKPIDTIDQRVMHLDGGAKRGVLVSLLREDDVGRAIVFTRTKRGADRVAQTVASAGFTADALHGNKSQGQRQRTLDAFRSGRLQVLIATDIAARGIDVDDISHVVNFDLPMVPEAYVHRIGRTARAGKSGQAISLCAHDERRLLRDIEKVTGKTLRVVQAPEAAEVIEQRPMRAAAPVARMPPARAPESDDAPRRPRRKPAGNGKPFGKPGGKFAGGKPKPRSADGTEQPRRQRSGGKPGGQKPQGGPRKNQDRDGLSRMLGGSNAA
jgi:ATP-dependent RNA helicase RhlE